MNGDPLFDELDATWAEIKRLRSVIRRIANQDATLAIVSGVIYADDEAVCDIGQTIQPVTEPLPVRKTT